MSSELPDNSVLCVTPDEWRRWLSEHYGQDEGVWMVTYKKSSGKTYLGYNEAVEEAICFGWVDSKSKGLDDERTMLWFAPRRAGSAWSKSNKDRVARLVASGRMMPAGIAKMESAKRDGSWNALDAIDALEVPSDLKLAFADHPGSEGHFTAFPRWVKRGVLQWIASAKRPNTRARRVLETAHLAQRNERPKQWRD